MIKNSKLLLIITMLVLVFIMAGCSNSGDNIVGRWEDGGNAWGADVNVLEFFSDGTGRHEETRWGIIDDFVWERRNGILTLTFDDGHESGQYYEILGDGTILILTLENGNVLELRKMD